MEENEYILQQKERLLKEYKCNTISEVIAKLEEILKDKPLKVDWIKPLSTWNKQAHWHAQWAFDILGDNRNEYNF